MLAYLFWHSPREKDASGYESALERFHRSLAARPPIGFLRSACYRAAAIPWLEGAVGYEDWYLIEDYTALGVLGEAAVAHGHRSAHERAAKALGAGTAGLYRLCEGAIGLREASVSVWVTPARLSEQSAVAGLLMADGAERGGAALWRRELVFGPACEYCLLAADQPAGVRPSRLPNGWRALALEREVVWAGE